MSHHTLQNNMSVWDGLTKESCALLSTSSFHLVTVERSSSFVFELEAANPFSTPLNSSLPPTLALKQHHVTNNTYSELRVTLDASVQGIYASSDYTAVYNSMLVV